MADRRVSSPASQSILRWKDQTGKQYEFYLNQGETIQIGRERENNLVLEEKHISRRHAIINWRNGVPEISDLGSANGTLVNGKRLTQPCALHDGDVICLYDTELAYSCRNRIQIKPESQPGEKKTFILPQDKPQPRLMVSAGPEEGKKILLHAGKMVIGRATVKENWDIPFQDRSISRPHAQVEMQGDSFIITDLGSANKTLVNGEPIQEPTPLQDGDVILVGETTLLFRIC
jgi:pSer/pThr/pTyr-binding forkhead associated (FHA) protein